ncbi:MAG: enoyl-CoA hydratase [Nocardioidaceae bacterium]|nr:enoyl-CoA hydratase [Nocardioidaceae bacterium]
MTSQPGLVGLDVRDHVATITLDSPANRNALSRRLVAELTAHLHAADARSDVRAIVVTHTGNTFCSGADLSEAAEQGMGDATHSLLGLLRLVVALSTPVVAVVKGHVRAGGVGLVGACDLAVCTDTSTFAFTEALLGLAPAIISLTTSSRLTEREAAVKYLTGEAFDGAEAARCGLLTASVSPDGIEAAVSSLLAGLLRASPQGLRETKRLLNAPLLTRMDADAGRLVELSARLFASEEARVAMAAFRERRPPPWTAGRSNSPTD